MRFFEPRGFIQYARVKKLYKEAFPKEERKPFSLIKKMHKRWKTDIWYFEDGKRFLGLATTINSDSIVLIDYFAVSPELRGKGYGTKMLAELVKYYMPQGVFVEIESTETQAANREERKKRKEFYIRSGFVPMNTRAKLFGVDMELLGISCSLSFDEYRRFYLENYGKFAYDNIKKV